MSKFVQTNFTLFFMQKSTTFINATSLEVNLEPTLLHMYLWVVKRSEVFRQAFEPIADQVIVHGLEFCHRLSAQFELFVAAA